MGKKSRNVITTCIDHNLVIPDAILIHAFKCFEEKLGTANMLSYISKKKFETNTSVRSIIFEILDYFENHILFDIAQNNYVNIEITKNRLVLCNI